MDRRAFLVTAAAVTAGCGQGSDAQTPDENGDESTPTDTPAPTATHTARPAALTVTDVSAPSAVEIATTVDLSVTVENAGGESGSLTAPVEARIGTGEWAETDTVVETTVPAGESVTETVELPAGEYVEPASYRLATADPVARTRFVARELALGDGHVLPDGVELSVTDVEFSETYTYRGDDGETTLQPTDGERWAIATVRAENTGDEPARAPLVSDIAIFRDEEEYAYQHISGNRDGYRGGDLAPGESTTGDLPSDVPRDAARADLRVAYSEELDGGLVTVNWTLDD